MQFTKLFNTLLDSTIWQESKETKLVWITMLAMADRNGEVLASIPGLAVRAGVSIPECEAALQCLLSPDPYSRTQEHEGRRIETIDGGWRLLNHGKYRALLSKEERREYNRRKKAEERARNKAAAAAVKETSAPVKPVNDKSAMSAQAEAEAEAEAEAHTEGDAEEEEEVREEKNKTMSTSKQVDVRRVFEYWQKTLDHPKAILDKKRTGIIKARLAEGFTVEDLCKAIDGVKASPHHNGHNDRNTVYHKFQTIFRDTEQVEHFIELVESPGRPPTNGNGFKSKAERDAFVQSEENTYAYHHVASSGLPDSFEESIEGVEDSELYLEARAWQMENLTDRYPWTRADILAYEQTDKFKRRFPMAAIKLAEGKA